MALASTAGLAALTGCSSVINPYTTELQYDASDGVSSQLGQVQTQNLLIVKGASGKTGEMHGLVYNSGDQDRTLNLTVGGSTINVTVPAKRSVRLDGATNGNDDTTTKAVTLNSLAGAKAGDQIDVKLSTSGGGTPATSQVSVPVLLDQEPYGSAKASHAEDEEPTEKHDTGIEESTPPPTGADEEGTSVTGG